MPNTIPDTISDTLFQVFYRCKNCGEKFSTGGPISLLEGGGSLQDVLESGHTVLHDCAGGERALAKPISVREAGTREVPRSLGYISRLAVSTA